MNERVYTAQGCECMGLTDSRFFFCDLCAVGGCAVLPLVFPRNEAVAAPDRMLESK
jgi:hypothetical protein